MLSGEVGYFRGAMQLTHPDFLVLKSPKGRTFGSKSLKTIADISQAESGELSMSAFERDFFPIYRGQLQTAELGDLRLRTSGARCAGARSQIRFRKALCANVV